MGDPVQTSGVKEKTSERYDLLWGRNMVGVTPAEYHYDRVARLLPPGHLAGRVLDAGCGQGIDTLKMAERSTGPVVGVDLSDGGVRRARARTQHLPNALIIRADLERLPVSSSQFDFIYSYGVLHHLPHPDQALAELVRALKPGGLLALYLYEDFESRNGLERATLWGVNQFRRITVRMPPRLLYGFCTLLSPLIYVTLTVPARILASIPGGERFSRRIPYHHSRRPLGLVGDLYDRFATPIERRYSRSGVEQWLKRAGLMELNVAPLRGWVGYGRKPKR